MRSPSVALSRTLAQPGRIRTTVADLRAAHPIRTRVDPPTQAGRVLQPVLVRIIEGRCGSTLLMGLLATSREVCFHRQYPYESRYLTYLCRLLAPLSSSFPHDELWGPDELLNPASTRMGPIPFKPSLPGAAVHAHLLLSGWAALSDCLATTHAGPLRYYAEKFPNLSTRELHDAGLPLRLIHLTRDPRDIIASIMAFDAKRGFYGFGRRQGEDERPYLTRLLQSMKVNLGLMDEERARKADVFTLRYEDLLVDMPAWTRQLEDWLDIRLDARRAAASWGSLQHHVTSTTPAASVGRWKRDLAHWQLELIERQLGQRMAALGYL